MARISVSTLYRFKGEIVTIAMFGWAALAGAQSSAPVPTAVPAVSAQAPAATAPAPASASAAATGKHAVAPIAIEKPLWKDLTPAQQRALEPLIGEWNKLDGLRKQKWLEIANRFASMKPDEQQRVHERMRDWLRLTPDQRRQVRENFARTQKITPGQKSVQWEQYQQLPEEQKKQLADKAPKKQVANPPTPTQSKIPMVAPVKSKSPAQPGTAAVPGTPGATPGAAGASPAPAAGSAAPAAGSASNAAPAAATPTTTPASPAVAPNVK